MKRLIMFFVFIAVVLLLYPYLEDSEQAPALTGLPWQIEVLPDGSSSVFGLTLAKSRLSDALTVLGEDMQLAIVAANDELGSLEMYYANYRAGLLSGKLVLRTSSSEANIRYWRDNAVKVEHMASGKAKKYMPSEDDLAVILKQVISGITFIPAVNLDEEIIIARFGQPAERVQVDGATHYLYPTVGLDIAVFEQAKEVLQYVSPNAFQRPDVKQEEL